MALKRLTKGDFDLTLGAFNPVGHSMLAFKDDAEAGKAREALLQNGFVDEDVLVYTSAEIEPAMTAILRHASESAGFGYEITLMRRYLKLANEGAGWLLVYAPEEEHIVKVVDVAKRHDAISAVAYHRLANEDLL